MTYLIAVGVVVAIVLLCVVCIVLVYNRLIVLQNRWSNGYAQIDVQLKRRYDLIPNLAEAVKGYFQHERSTLEAVISARNSAALANAQAARQPQDTSSLAGIVAAEGVLHGQLGRFMGLAEGYPDLKADQTVLRLMEDLTSTENRVAFARQAFNDAVMQYNTARQSFPAVIVAKRLGFHSATLFTIDDATERKAVKVSLDGARPHSRP